MLRSSRKLHSDLTAANRNACKPAAREVQLAIRDNCRDTTQARASSRATPHPGALRRAVSTTEPRKTSRGYEAEVFMRPDETSVYASIHEYGGVIRARNKPYLVFKVKGQWVRVKQVRIRQKRFWRGVTPSNMAVKIRQRTEEMVRMVK